MQCRYRLASLFLLAAGTFTAYANDVESLHNFNVNFDFRPGWTLQMHARVRTFEDMSAYNQFRVGPILMWQVLKRVNLIGGYYFTNQNTRVIHRDTDLQRYWGGGQLRWIAKRQWTLDTRHLIERFNPEPEVLPDYWRQRHRALATINTPKVQPFFGVEALRQQNRWYGRYVSGIQFRPVKRMLMGFGYEYRDAIAGPGSHVITTTLQFDAYRHTPQHID